MNILKLQFKKKFLFRTNINLILYSLFYSHFFFIGGTYKKKEPLQYIVKNYTFLIEAILRAFIST